MSTPKYLSSLFLLCAIACGGATDVMTSEEGGGSDAGGSTGDAGHAGKATAGKSSGGSGHTAGTSAGGSTGDGGSINVAGTIGIGGTIVFPQGGTGPIDPRCPPTQPPAMTSCAENGASCQYDFVGCLCYPTAPGTFGFCNRVDPTCMGPTVAPPPEPAPEADGSAGFGGISAKIALPPKLVCSCNANQWLCNYGP